MNLYQQNRKRFQVLMTLDECVAIIPTNTAKMRNHDCDYRFRPDSDFWYLTGFAEPGCVLVLIPGEGDDEAGKSILFLRESNKQMEIWNGKRLGLQAAPEALGVDEAYDIEELWTKLPELLVGHPRLLYRLGMDDSMDLRFTGMVKALRSRARKGIEPPVEIVDGHHSLHEMRLHKSAEEADLMRKAAEITTEAHLAAMAATRDGVNECEIDALIDYTFRRRGANGQAYSSIVAGGENACILHYVENDQPLKDGELLLIDAGAEYQCYASDVTRTFPVSGTFSEPQRALYEVVLKAQEAAIAAVKPGVPTDQIHEVSLNGLVDGLIELGLIEGPRAKALEKKTFRDFFMHGTSHWLGLDVHDCGSYAEDGESRELEPGMVLTVEPGLYVDPENMDVDAKWRGIGIRIEDDILVTEDGHENLTIAIPKSIEAVEAACQASDALSPIGG
ncbi:MAG: aminopeptidase P N-terminal domain-containing protein [Planctomycetes bacterium]|nr:aminopeptidase P N-terminal domain-containing protein [Planctomycetota bacterium]